jgi:transcriptional regulator EpsA
MFSRDDIRLLLDVMGMCSEARIDEDLSEILAGPVRTLLPHCCVAYGLCQPSTGKILHIRNVDFPEVFVTGVSREGDALLSPIASRWKQSCTAIHYRPAEHRPASDRDERFDQWHDLFSSTGLDGVLVHGVVDRQLDISSYFAFGKEMHDPNGRDGTLLSILLPYLHGTAVLMGQRRNTRSKASKNGSGGISHREREILGWVQLGKTNYEIGCILGISEFTVKNHMKRICSKLDAGNRTHAIAKATRAGLLASC